MPDGRYLPLRVRSLVGLMPLLAVETIEPELLEAMPGFQGTTRMVSDQPSRSRQPDFALVRTGRGRSPPDCADPRSPNEMSPAPDASSGRISERLRRALDEQVSRSTSVRSCVRRRANASSSYEPAESQTNIFGGNSNWRGPVWFPINYLLIESLQKFHHYYGDDFKVECPTGSGQFLTLNEIANELSNRLIQLWLRDEQRRASIRPRVRRCAQAERDRDLYLFHEYFHGDTGAGLGASHQTGWTGLDGETDPAARHPRHDREARSVHGPVKLALRTRAAKNCEVCCNQLDIVELTSHTSPK